MEDRLSFLLRTPALVEGVVREALRRALAARHVRDEPLDVRSFSNLALACLARRLRDHPLATDAVGRHELEAATVRAAAAFGASKLARRLFRVPLERITPGPRGADVTVRDPRGRPHHVRLETYRAPSDRLRELDALARAMPTRELDAKPPAIHFFSLLDGCLRSYPAVEHATDRTGRAARDVA